MENGARAMWLRDFLSLSPRRRTLNYLLDPARQLRVPIYTLAITFGFGAIWLWSLLRAFEEFYRQIIAEQPPTLEAVLYAQASDLILLTGLLAVAFVCTLFGIAIVTSHRFVGPRVPLLRQIASLEGGDYSARVELRRGDAFTEVADALNQLAESLEERDKQP